MAWLLRRVLVLFTLAAALAAQRLVVTCDTTDFA